MRTRHTIPQPVPDDGSVGRLSPTSLALLVACLGVAFVALVLGTRATAATITASYAAGHPNVSINDYGTQALGTFTMRFDQGDPGAGTTRLALCIEAASAHTTASRAYRQVANRVVSPPLDYLLWKYGEPGTAEYRSVASDHDTATALAALGWYYAGATRRGGGAVWANWADGFSAVSPTSPHRWDALPRFGTAFPVGLRSGGTDLDVAERRVLELHLEATARRGPWTMSNPAIGGGGSSAAVTISGPGGPIGGLRGIRFVVSDAGGSVRLDRTVVADSSGRATLSGLALAPGDSVEVTTAAPGVHHEWDGDGDVQRMATPTSTQLRASATVPGAPPTTTTSTSTTSTTTPTPTTTLPAPTTPPPATSTTTTTSPTTTTTTSPTTTTTTTTTTVPPPAPRHVRVVKSSSDATITPTGAVFRLLDASGVVVGEAIAGDDGTATFPPIDPAAHPGPYRLREVAAPAGLLPVESELEITPPYSVDPAAPTVVSLVNHPATVEVVVRKRLSEPDVGPGDLTGFEFSVERVADQLDLGTAMTGPDGRSPAVITPSGRLRICETGRPPWSAVLVDPGCVEIDVGPPVPSTEAQSPTPPIEVEYTNVVPVPTISTQVTDPVDGDQEIDGSGGQLVDRVTLGQLVPGTSYQLRTELVALDGDSSTTGITAVVDLVASEPDQVIEVPLEVPSDPPFTAAVVVQRLWVGDRLVAEHVDLDDEAQTITVAPPDDPVVGSTSPVERTEPPVRPLLPIPPTTAPSSVPTGTTPVTVPETTVDAAAPPGSSIVPPSTAVLDDPGPASSPPRRSPISLPGTGSALARVMVGLGVAALGVGLVAVLWSAPWPWTTISPTRRRQTSRSIRRPAGGQG